MLAGTLAFATGIYCLLQFSTLPPIWVISFLPLLVFFTWFYPILRPVLLFFLGFSWALFRADAVINQILPKEIEQQEVILTGVVISIPEIYTDHIRFQFKINEIKGVNSHIWSLPVVARLSWYKYKQTPAPGEVWRLKAILKRPWGFMNPGGFDYEAWLLRQGISSHGYVKQGPENHRLEKKSGYFIQQLRFKISNRLKEIIDESMFGLGLALGLGDRSQLHPDQLKTLARTGTSHLIAISGLHLGLIAGLFYFLARYIWSRFYYLTQRLPAPVFASIAAFIAAFIYAALTGFALPTQRALIMIGVLLLSLLSGRQIVVTHLIAIAAFLILLFDPFAIIAADFWLSFMAVCFIFYVTRFRISKQDSMTQWIRVQCYLSMALVPLLIFWFKQVPVYSVIANIVAIPVIGFVIVPLVLLATVLIIPFPLLSFYIYKFIAVVAGKQWAFLEYIAEQNYGVIPIAAPSVFALILAVSGILILLMPRGLPARWLGLLWLLPLFFPQLSKPAYAEFDFTLLDVGQGLAAVIETNEHVLIYDTGAYYSERFNLGDAVIIPYLRYNGINTISMLLISHGDNDHIGGAKSILENFTIGKVLTSVPEKLPSGNAEFCYAGQKWNWDGVMFEILHPDLNSPLSGNNNSCVLKVSGPYGSVLLTGDIEKQAENILLKRSASKLKADILIVPHHGSKTSSTTKFIESVSPQFAFFPAGYKNRFGFPKQDILSRYETHDIDTRVSYKSGALLVKFCQNGIQINEFRPDNQRFWHRNDFSISVSD